MMDLIQERERTLPKHVSETTLSGVYRINWPSYADNRGKFQELIEFHILEDLGIDFAPAQWQWSLSHPKVFRGIHAEPMQKLIAPLTGRVKSCLLDLRQDSPTFLKYEFFDFNDENRGTLFIPKGVGNSFYVEGSKDAVYAYMQDVAYTGNSMPAVFWKDERVKIPWPFENPIISDRDNLPQAIPVDEFLKGRDEIYSNYLQKKSK